MEKLFVPYEIALQLKEKGFDEFCIGLFNEEGLQYDGEIYSFPFHNSLTKEGAVDPSIVAAPLYQQVIDWFREKEIRIIELPHPKLNPPRWALCVNEEFRGGFELDKTIQEALKFIP